MIKQTINYINYGFRKWWLGVGLPIIPWLLWFKFRKKESSDRLLYVGYFVILISSWLDIMGVALGWWFYKSKVIPVIPTYIPWDITLMPV
ncbi:MAG: CBO0543 family protein [Bacillota bacterium]